MMTSRLLHMPGGLRRLSAAVPARPAGRRAASSVKLTAEAYPELARDRRFARLTDEDVAHFRRVLGDGGVVDGPDDLEPLNTDWMGKYRGQARLALRPGSTAQVSAVLRYCHERSLAVVPQGGNTGLVGGSVPVFDEIIVSLARMNRVRAFDDVSGDLVVDAGVVLEAAERHVAERGHTFPLDLGAKGSCQVGGNVSTNAGGLRLLRYGNLHGSVLGLEAVLPDGTVLDDLCTLRKNNTGYDLKQLFVGAEGTLGIVTAAAVQCPQRSPAVGVALVGIESFGRARDVFREAKARLGEILSAFEMMDVASQRLVRRARADQHPQHHPPDHPLPGRWYPFYCLIETRGSDGEHDGAKLERLLEHVLDRGLVADGVVAQDETQARALWDWREGIPECMGRRGGVYKYDVSVRLPDMYTLVEDTRQRLAEEGLAPAPDAADQEGTENDAYPVLATVGYGHMGDSNLHLNVGVRGYGDSRVERALEPWLYEWIAAHGGSISAEHGLGLAKRRYIGHSRNPTAIGLMRQIKNLFDPKGIMNPYKYI